MSDEDDELERVEKSAENIEFGLDPDVTIGDADYCPQDNEASDASDDEAPEPVIVPEPDPEELPDTDLPVPVTLGRRIADIPEDERLTGQDKTTAWSKIPLAPTQRRAHNKYQITGNDYYSLIDYYPSIIHLFSVSFQVAL